MNQPSVQSRLQCHPAGSRLGLLLLPMQVSNTNTYKSSK
jgi:hypothetical protein